MSETNILQVLIDSSLTEFKSLGDYLNANENQPKELGGKIAQKKAENPDLTYLDVKDELIDLQLTFMDNEMVRSNIQLFAIRLASLTSVATAMNIKLKLSPDDEMLLNNIKEGSKPFFTVKGDELVPLDKEYYDSIREEFLKRAKDERTMISNFEAIRFKTM